jgi:glycosyltransferase involved in cell wall biosynthesis
MGTAGGVSETGAKGALAEPLVSIVLPTHNGSRYLRESIDSCLRQTYEHLELIIVNDGSTDETDEIVRSYRDPRIVYARHHPNQGLPRALNVGFALAKGDYLTWTSDDNYYADEAIQVMLEELRSREPRQQFVYCDCTDIDERGQVVVSEGIGGEPEALRTRNPVGACFLYTRRVAEVVGAYNPALPLAEDYEYWLRVFLRFRMHHIGRNLYYYRRHPSALSSADPDAQALAAVEARRLAFKAAPQPRKTWEALVRAYRSLRFAKARVENRLRLRRRARALFQHLAGNREE